MRSGIDKRDYWVCSDGFDLATHAHLPATQYGRTAVLVCSTVGFEAIHAYRGLVRLGDELAAHGIPAFRFDFAGTGNSSGNLDGADLVSVWQNNVVDQVRDLRERWGFHSIAIVGFRLGATLACATLDRAGVDALVLWEPVTRGKSFAREIRAVAQFAEDAASGEPDHVESGGFAFPADTLDAIGQLSLMTQAIPPGIPVLLIGRGRNARLNAKAFETRNPFAVLTTREYDRMICEPHYTELPVDSISRINEWVTSAFDASPGETAAPELTATADIDAGLTETQFRTGNGLFGIVTRPADFKPGERPTVVLANAGSVCTVGPNRVYVELARALALDGVEVVRFDLRNLGDSVTADVANANSPYPDSAGDDVERILEWCRAWPGQRTFVLAGLCSGSHSSYHFALDNEDPDVNEIVLINPLTYYYTPGMSLDNPLQHRTVRNAKSYAKSARDLKNWRRLFTGKINYRRLARFSLRVFAGALRNAARSVSSLWTRHRLSQMDADLARLCDRGLRVSFVFSDTDPGYWIARLDSPNTFRTKVANGESKVMFLKEADHTLSRARNRTDLIDNLREHFLAGS